MLISSSSESESLSCLINQPWKYYINKYSSSQFTRCECAERALNRTRKRIFLKSLTGDEDLLYFLNRRGFKSSDASFCGIWLAKIKIGAFAKDKDKNLQAQAVQLLLKRMWRLTGVEDAMEDIDSCRGMGRAPSGTSNPSAASWRLGSIMADPCFGVAEQPKHVSFSKFSTFS